MFKQLVNVGTRRIGTIQKSLQASYSSGAAPTVSSNNVTVGGHKIHYEQAGSGPITALCLPGALGWGAGDFKAQLSGLAGQEVSLIAWDPPGYGRSRPPDRRWDNDFFHRDADVAGDLMKALGHSRYSILGWSDGGITGLILAARRPAAVRALVVWGTNAYFNEEDIRLYEGLRDVSTWSPRMRAPMEAVYGVDGFQALWGAWVDAVSGILRTKEGNICKDLLSAITCPTLVVHGAKDAMVPAHHSAYLLDNIAGAKLVTYENGKHNLHMKYAAEFNELVRTFLLQHCPATAV